MGSTKTPLSGRRRRKANNSPPRHLSSQFQIVSIVEGNERGWVKRRKEEGRRSELERNIIDYKKDSILMILDYLVRIEDLAPALRACKYALPLPLASLLFLRHSTTTPELTPFALPLLPDVRSYFFIQAYSACGREVCDLEQT